MTRDEERVARSQQLPIVGGLPDALGIAVALRLTPGLGVHLRGLADELLVNEFPGATIGRADREMLATAVSAQNDCFFCMDSHAAHASAVLAQSGSDDMSPILDGIKRGSLEGVEPKVRALVQIARVVARAPAELSVERVADARAAGASDADVQLAVLIAAAFSMYNRIVEGFRARTPATSDAYRDRADEIAKHGYAGGSAQGRRPDLR